MQQTEDQDQKRENVMDEQPCGIADFELLAINGSDRDQNQTTQANPSGNHQETVEVYTAGDQQDEGV